MFLIKKTGGHIMKNTEKVTFERVKIDHTTGEITSQEFIHRYSNEPAYIKLYLDCISQLNGFSKSLNPILVEFLKYMTYADRHLNDGGQIIYLNGQLKREIAKATGKTVKRIEQAITDFCKAKIFKRIATSTYQVNPYLFGKGDWKDIKNIRATIDFGAKTVENLEIIKSEQEQADTEEKGA